MKLRLGLAASHGVVIEQSSQSLTIAKQKNIKTRGNPADDISSE